MCILKETTASQIYAFNYVKQVFRQTSKYNPVMDTSPENH